MARPRETEKSPKLKGANLLVNLPPDLLDRFQQRVPRAEQDAFVQRLLETALQQREPEGETMTVPKMTDQPKAAPASADAPASDLAPETDWDLIEAIWSQIPDEEFDKLPPDGSAQHDHYIYGVAKRAP